MTFGFIPSPAQNGFSIGPLFLHAYGLAYVFAVAAAIFIGRRRWARAGGDPDLCYEVALWGFPAGLIGGRIYFLITTPSQIPDHWWGPFAIWKGGLGIWGGMACGIAVGAYVARRRLSHQDFLRFIDAGIVGLPVAQAIGRIGNYFNQELFGKPSTLPWALKISPAHRPPHYTQYATFQPTFLYEIIWDLGLAAFLVWIGNHRKIKPPGLLALYVAGYSGFRIFEEQLRIDYSKHILGFRLNFWVACILCLLGLLWFVAIQRGWHLRGRRPPAQPADTTPPRTLATSAAGASGTAGRGSSAAGASGTGGRGSGQSPASKPKASGGKRSPPAGGSRGSRRR
jgi:prolipoprotein diacylglyceryl transferase